MTLQLSSIKTTTATTTHEINNVKKARVIGKYNNHLLICQASMTLHKKNRDVCSKKQLIARKNLLIN
jgi:hypothetical protein